MQRYQINPRGLVLALMGSVLLCACASQPKTLYQWDGYQSHVYSYLKGGANADPEKQILELEADLQKIRAHGNNPPPGFYAHLGLMYVNAGKFDKMNECFLAEEKLFPESAPFLSYLRKKSNH